MPASTPSTMPTNRSSSFFLTSFFTAFSRQQTGTSSTSPLSSTLNQPNKQQPAPQQTLASQSQPSSSPSSPPPGPQQPGRLQSHMHSTAIPVPGTHNTSRRGSNSSSEGFRDVLGNDKWYIGGRTAAGEEKFFKLGVVRRVRSGDRLSLDRLSL